MIWICQVCLSVTSGENLQIPTAPAPVCSSLLGAFLAGQVGNKNNQLLICESERGSTRGGGGLLMGDGRAFCCYLRDWLRVSPQNAWICFPLQDVCRVKVDPSPASQPASVASLSGESTAARRG